MQSAETKPHTTTDTIAAVATPQGRGGIGIVRVSGPGAAKVASRVIGRVPPARTATPAVARDARGNMIDRGIALFFPGPRSYTGEDVFEFQGHGGPEVTRLVLGACLDAGARTAAAGEFTRRAFLNDKLDLAQAEAVADLIDAASEEAARSAMRSLSGEFSSEIDALVRELTELRALTEAMLDFPEEEVDKLHAEDAQGRLSRIRQRMGQVMERSRQGSLLREGIHVVIAGRPNVGKSSLLNRLAGEERAIVTAQPGTTRDTLREAIRIEGVPIHVVDTAGLRETDDEVECEGIARAWREVDAADLVLFILEANLGIGPHDEEILQRIPAQVQRLRVYNKVDLAPGREPGASASEPGMVYVSAKTGAGLDCLRREIVAAAGWKPGGEPVFLARERHLRALQEAGVRLGAAAAEHARWELFAEELRLAQEALASVTGEFSADDLLGEIFTRFCIGK
jgi:tRNA modification GTPase